MQSLQRIRRLRARRQRFQGEGRAEAEDWTEGQGHGEGEGQFRGTGRQLQKVLFLSQGIAVWWTGYPTIAVTAQ